MKKIEFSKTAALALVKILTRYEELVTDGDIEAEFSFIDDATDIRNELEDFLTCDDHEEPVVKTTKSATPPIHTISHRELTNLSLATMSTAMIDFFYQSGDSSDVSVKLRVIDGHNTNFITDVTKVSLSFDGTFKVWTAIPSDGFVEFNPDQNTYLPNEWNNTFVRDVVYTVVR